MPEKSFRDNPTYRFLSGASEVHEEEVKEAVADKEVNKPQKNPSHLAAPPEGFKLNPLYIETKRRRLQLVMQPSLYDRVKHKAAMQGLSVNEYIHRVLDAATQDNAAAANGQTP